MAEKLFIKPSDMAATTILGGNVDPDKIVVNIAFAQLNTIEPLLGTELYDKIYADVVDCELSTLTGLYATLYEDYVQPITKHEALAEYIEVSNYMLDNGGVFKHTAENRESTTKDDTQFLSDKYHSLAQMYIGRFNKWISLNTIYEYKTYQDEVNAQNVVVKAGWYFDGGGLID